MKKNEVISNFQWHELEQKEEGPSFTYRNSTYCLNDFMSFKYSNPNYDEYWDGYLTTDNFGGIVVKLNESCDAVQVGRSK